MYKYEMHVHSSEASLCATSTAKELVNAYKQAGYAGFVLTNHFIHGNTSIPRELPWEERMMGYYNAYLLAKEEGDKIGFDVLFGVEHNYGNGKEVLIYGLDIDFWIQHPELRNGSIDLYDQLVHKAGGVIVHAHPHRVRGYITPGILPRYDVCDGVEVYNSADDSVSNEKAYQDAVKLNKFMLSGADVHEHYCPRIGSAGMVFPEPIQSNKNLVDNLLGRKGVLIVEGKMLD